MPRPAHAMCLLTAVCSAAAPAAVVTVHVFDYDFSVDPRGEPARDAVIDPGDTVRWEFLDSGHSTTSVRRSAETWDSGYVGIVGETFEHTFSKSGTFVYYCFPHGADRGDGTAAGMAGTIEVLCRADFDADGRLGSADFIEFHAAFARRDPRADYTRDARWNINDFVAFQAAYVRGCG